ncbi:thioredoxin [Bacillus coahuilensis m2-6]|uniref:thioredoxin family protein n=1 Tax=Bacillus coahuilensis TaxID=408580 RepID=UPI000185119F|nr:thioredoxin family protein [Bacillus coahuilensis]KUP06712.1 thioredoxin [Bacillus coahuilensis m2-6]
MKKLASIEEFHELKASGTHMFLFSADWCPDCRVIDPILPELEEEYRQFTWVYVDRDQFIDVCIEHDIFGIPSFLAYQDGKELGRFVSKDRKTKEEIVTFIESLSF